MTSLFRLAAVGLVVMTTATAPLDAIRQQAMLDK
jgi:predicted PilT family ATPase